MNSCLYAGTLIHRRTRPVRHQFRYSVSVHYLDLDELEGLGRSLRLFGVNAANLISFWDRDHLEGRDGNTKGKIVAFLRSRDVDLDDGKIFLLTQCRVFHYVFNPVSFYYCHDRQGELRAVVAEVNNTFGERYLYLLCDHNRLAAAETDARRYRVQKHLHVSPFVSMNASYDFRFAPVTERLSVRLTETEDGRKFFDAHLGGSRIELSDRSLAWTLARYPFLTLRIIGAIHWQALRLYLKGAAVYRQPPPSAEQSSQLELLHRLRKGIRS